MPRPRPAAARAAGLAPAAPATVRRLAAATVRRLAAAPVRSVAAATVRGLAAATVRSVAATVRSVAAAAGLVALAVPAGARADAAGDFDYWVLALSWSPSWCAGEPGREDAEQCDPDADFRFVVHGLWPQYERGWPEFCETDARDPTRRETRAMAGLMGSAGLAAAQWRKHGTCSGLDAAGYFERTRDAAGRVRIPRPLTELARGGAAPPGVIEGAFVEVNPGLSREGVTVTCRDGRLAEVRVCLDRDLRFRRCAPDAARDCRARELEVPAPP
jgi:ribonuclease T2